MDDCRSIELLDCCNLDHSPLAYNPAVAIDHIYCLACLGQRHIFERESDKGQTLRILLLLEIDGQARTCRNAQAAAGAGFNIDHRQVGDL